MPRLLVLCISKTDSNNGLQNGEANSTVHSVYSSCIATSTVLISNNGVHSRNASRATSLVVLSPRRETDDACMTLDLRGHS
jgi:hypothetical protein